MKHLLALLLATLTTASQAQFLTANDLYSKMLDESATAKSVALGYVVGVFDSTIGDTQCAPAGVTGRQIHDLVKLNIEKFPQHREKEAYVFVSAVFMSTWPCKKSTTEKTL